MTFFGIEIKKQTDILAFAAFLISIGGIIGQVYHFSRGAKLSLSPPTKIILRGHKNPNKKQYLNVIARLNVLNAGHPGYNDIVEDMTVTYLIDGKQRRLTWLSFCLTDEKENRPEKLEVEILNDASPQKIEAQDVFSQEIIFSPTSELIDGKVDYGNFVEWNDFLGVAERKRSLSLAFHCSTSFGRNLKKTCRVIFDDHHIKAMREENWICLRCNP